jgi:2-methylcitrate dehydratase PrpD
MGADARQQSCCSLMTISSTAQTGPADADPRTSDVSGGLARFIATSRWEDVPEAARHETKRSLLNFFATALGGCRDEALEVAHRVLGEFSASQEATVIGRRARTDALNAAFLNGASANVLDFDDTHVGTVIHPTAPVAPAVFALAERRPVSGAELLHAFLLGVEAECRIGNAVSPGHYRRGFHITATCGVFGAAAAAARLIGLDARKTLFALGNASAQSSGLVETLGTMAKSLGVGNAARNGLIAALLAERGFAGPDRPLEGARGFGRVTGDDFVPERLTDGLGETWEILNNTYKPYPCGVVLHPVLDACLELRARYAPVPEYIVHVVVTGHPLLRERTDRPAVATGREAQVSVQHSVAVALLYGAAGVAQYTDAAVHDPGVLAFRRKVVVKDDAGMAIEAARVEIETSDGKILSSEVAHARGSLQRPLSDAELEAKLVALAATGCPLCNMTRLIDAVWSLDRAPEAAAVIALATPAA